VRLPYIKKYHRRLLCSAVKVVFLTGSDRDHDPGFDPFLQSLFLQFFDLTEYEGKHGDYEPGAIYNLEWYKDADRRRRILHPEASWRRIFPVQPLARIEHVTPRGGCYCIDVERREGAIRDDFQILQENGAMMSFIWDVTVHFMNAVPESNFFVQWYMLPQVPTDEDEDEMDVDINVVEDSDGSLRVVTENKITIQIGHSFSCYPSQPVPCELKAVGCDPRIIECENEGLEGQGRGFLANAMPDEEWQGLFD